MKKETTPKEVQQELLLRIVKHMQNEDSIRRILNLAQRLYVEKEDEQQ